MKELESFRKKGLDIVKRERRLRIVDTEIRRPRGFKCVRVQGKLSVKSQRSV